MSLLNYILLVGLFFCNSSSISNDKTIDEIKGFLLEEYIEKYNEDIKDIIKNFNEISENPSTSIDDKRIIDSLKETFNSIIIDKNSFQLKLIDHSNFELNTNNMIINSPSYKIAVLKSKEEYHNNGVHNLIGNVDAKASYSGSYSDKDLLNNPINKSISHSLTGSGSISPINSIHNINKYFSQRKIRNDDINIKLQEELYNMKTKLTNLYMENALYYEKIRYNLKELREYTNLLNNTIKISSVRINDENHISSYEKINRLIDKIYNGLSNVSDLIISIQSNFLKISEITGGNNNKNIVFLIQVSNDETIQEIIKKNKEFNKRKEEQLTKRKDLQTNLGDSLLNFLNININGNYTLTAVPLSLPPIHGNKSKFTKTIESVFNKLQPKNVTSQLVKENFGGNITASISIDKMLKGVTGVIRNGDIKNLNDQKTDQELYSINMKLRDKELKKASLVSQKSIAANKMIASQKKNFIYQSLYDKKKIELDKLCEIYLESEKTKHQYNNIIIKEEFSNILEGLSGN